MLKEIKDEVTVDLGHISVLEMQTFKMTSTRSVFDLLQSKSIIVAK